MRTYISVRSSSIEVHCWYIGKMDEGAGSSLRLCQRPRLFPKENIQRLGTDAAGQRFSCLVKLAGGPQRAVGGPCKQQAQQGDDDDDENAGRQLVPPAADVDVAVPATSRKGRKRGSRLSTTKLTSALGSRGRTRARSKRWSGVPGLH